MRVLIDVLGMPPHGGARTAAVGWVKALAINIPAIEFVVLVNHLEQELQSFTNIDQMIIATPGRLLPRLHLQLLIPRLVQQLNIDVVHFMRNLAAIIPNAKVVVNINDLTRLLIPGTFSKWDILYWKLIQQRVLRYAQRIICISEKTRQDVCQWLNYPSNKVKTIYPAIQPVYQPVSAELHQAIRKKYSLNKPFILYVGGLAKHKNLRTLISAFVQLKQTSNLPHKLVIVGGQFHTHNDIGLLHLTNNSPLADVIFTGAIHEADMPAMYSAADLFVFPTRYEGFGLAPLEAMACGTPVIASRVGSLPEVLAEAAYWIDDPLDEVAFTNAMHYLLLHQTKQTNLIKQGLTQASSFSWGATAQQTQELYHDIMRDTL